MNGQMDGLVGGGERKGEEGYEWINECIEKNLSPILITDKSPIKITSYSLNIIVHPFIPNVLGQSLPCSRPHIPQL